MIKNDWEELSNLSETVYNFLQNADFTILDDGRKNLDKGCYVNVETYNTRSREECRFESHRKYIDVQYIINGAEKIIIVPSCDLKQQIPYDSSKDIEFFSDNEKGEMFSLEAGDFLVIPPETAHMPCVSFNRCTRVRKAVFKIPSRKNK